MDPERKRMLQRLKNDFPLYALNCLKVRTKSGKIEEFKLNKAQQYVHKQLQDQLARTGKVRALILKARQQGMCYSPDMRVLTADYKWKKIDDIKIGEELIGIDEHLSENVHVGGRRYPRKLRSSIVEVKAELISEVFEIKLDNGAILKATSQHRHLCRKRGGDDAQWREVSKTKIGDSIRYISPPPKDSLDPYEDGWFGGLLDGEGTYRESPHVRLSFCQVDGPVLQRAKKYLTDRNISFYENIDNRENGTSSKFGDKPVHCIAINRFAETIEILSKCRPSRFVNKKIYEGHELPGKAIKGGGKCWAKVISIQAIGKMRVIDLQTSTKTFICEGVVSHNSTYIGARFYHKVVHSFGCQAFILTHSLEATNNLFKMAQRFHEHVPDWWKASISKSNAKELVFGDLDSGYKLGTAENKNVGRSQTIQLLHWSETAFSANTADHSVGILQAVPNADGTEIILESTANGIGNFYHQQWQLAEAGISDYIAIFVPWFWQAEYQATADVDFARTPEEEELAGHYNLTNDQLNWRRKKIIELSVNGVDGSKAFKQEYPSCAAEAFQLTGQDNYIPSDIVLNARKTTDVEKVGPLIIGCDPARFGDDRTAIIRRVGRVAYKFESHAKLDTMQVAGLLKTIIESERPAKVCIDIGGLGAGVVDRLRELGFGDIVESVNFGASPFDAQKFRNKKAEMWASMFEWLKDVPVSIPDSDELHSDLTSVKYAIDSNSRLVIEPKEFLKKRGIRSPDSADALCLTFALPNSALYASINRQQDDMLAGFAQSSMEQFRMMSKR